MNALMTRDQLVRHLAGTGSLWYVMLTGADASGKSTLARALKEHHGFTRLSLDKLDEKHPELDQKGELKTEFKRRLKSSLRRFQSVVDDNTNLDEDERLGGLNSAREHRLCHIVIVHMDVSLEQCHAWNAKRKPQKRRIPMHLEMHWRHYQNCLPDASEGMVIRVKPRTDGMYEVFDQRLPAEQAV